MAPGRVALRGWALALVLMLALPAEAAVPELRINGLSRVTEQNLRAHLGTLDERFAEPSARRERIVAAALQAALQPYGYYESGYTLEQQGNVITLSVERGPRVVYAPSQIQVDPPADSVPAIAVQVLDAPFNTGKPLSHARYDDYREDLLQTARRLGFFEARYRRSELRVDPAARLATVILELEPGPRYHFTDTRIEGTGVDRELLLSLARFRSGDPFDNDLVAGFEQRLRDTGYFRELVVRVEREEQARARVSVLASDNITTRYDVGVGFSTDSDLRLRFNRHTPLANSSGHSLSIESEISEPRQAVEAVYRVPHHDPLDDILEFTAGLQGKKIEDTDSKTATAGIRHALKLFGEWSYSYGLNAELERYTVGSATEKDVAYLMPVTTISRTRLQPGIDPLNGYALWSALDFSTRDVGSPAEFLRWRVGAKWLYGLPNDNTTLLWRSDLGAIWTDGFNQLPASLRFSAGGDRSIRGYDVDSLGPRDGNGKLIGGRYLAVGSLEISHRVRPQWRIAAFVDGGSAFSEKHDNFYQSAGVGVRWLSPIGQIRVDLAMPVRDGENSGFKIHVSMGPPL